MDFYVYLNFVVLILFTGTFLFLYIIMVFLSYKLKPYEKIRSFYLKEVEFWNPQKGFELIKTFFREE